MKRIYFALFQDKGLIVAWYYNIERMKRIYFALFQDKGAQRIDISCLIFFPWFVKSELSKL